MPYFKGEGIRDTNKIIRVRTIMSKEAKQMEGDTEVYDLRLAFEPQYFRKQYDGIQPIRTTKIISRTFIDTTFDKLDKIVIINKEL